ncbi:hypothetical protein PENSUB_5550 [Penicillium subrubescens]|uniref:Uncharacterized protein n=1 Tax=Penicillium subrubescens TaxID=1316194 RepID=A0A1Q5U7Y0_9EURO|nr:hypothetical protein PENSUB_5550 [Penicillium subrubescens]
MNITSLQATGLDQNFSPLMPSNPSTRPDEKAVEACRPIRNVDWREDPQPVENFHQRLVAHWQRCGEAAPQGKQYSPCKRGSGFSTAASSTTPVKRCSQEVAV